MTRFLPITIISFLSGALAVSAQETDTMAVNRLSEIVVTGSNQAVDGRYLPYTVSTVGRAELEAASSTRVLDILSGRVPGFFVTGRNVLGFGVSNGGAGHIKLRGVGGDRASAVLMMVDGQPQFAGIYSHQIGDFYTKEHVERVEVLRGPGSVLYGSNAMAGVVNVVTRGVSRDGFHATLSTSFGSHNTSESALTATVRSGRFSALVSGGYDRTDGTVRNFDFKQGQGYAKVGCEFSDAWKAFADFTLMNFIGNDPIYPTLSDPASTDIYHQNITRGEASVWAANSYGAVNGVARVYYSYGNHYIDDPNHFHSTDDRIGVLLYENFSPWRDADATVGFDFATYRGSIPVSGGRPIGEGNLGAISRKSITETSPYLTLSQSLAKQLVVLSAGVRAAVSDKFGTQWVPQGGVVLNLPAAFTVKASAAMGYRNPSFRELYLYRMANPDLKPEKMMNYEISVARNFAHGIRLSLTGYYSRGTDMIDVVDQKNVNTGRFINKGVEAEGSWRMNRALNVFASYSFLHTSLDNLTGAPRHQYSLGAEWRPLHVLSVAANLKGVAGLFVADGMDKQNYAVLDLKAEWQIVRYMAVNLRLDNITDARYTINRGYRMPGFCAFGGLKLSI